MRMGRPGQGRAGDLCSRPTLSTCSQLLPIGRDSWRDPSATGHPHHGDAGGTAMDQPCKEGIELGSRPQGGQGQTLLWLLLSLRELQVTPRRDTRPGQLMDHPMGGHRFPSPGVVVPITAHRMGKGDHSFQIHQGPAPQARSPQSHPRSSSIPPVQAMVQPAQLWGWTPTTSSIPNPRPCQDTTGVAGATINTSEKVLGQTQVNRAYRQQVSPARPCLLPAPRCPVRTQLSAEPHGRAQPDLPAREAGARRPLSCFLPVVQAERPGAPQGQSSTGPTMQRELPWQRVPVPGDPGMSCRPGALCSRGTVGDESLPSILLQHVL